MVQQILDALTRRGKSVVPALTESEIKALELETMPPATKPSIANIEMPSADTEYLHMLPKGCKKFLLHCRDGTAFRLAFKRGKVATPTQPYFTMKANTSYSEDNLDVEEDTWLYLACGTASKVIEIVQWS